MAAMMLTHALKYAERGLPVFPCRVKPSGKFRAKSPHVENGLHMATLDASMIRTWWGHSWWPDAAIGMPTGDPTGRFVLDVDPGKGGETALEMLVSEHGPLPDTSVVLTGGGGSHYYFAMPGNQEIRNSSSKLGPGLDIRGTGGYVIVPPSNHESGRTYEWELSSEGLAEAPPWLLRLLEEHAKERLPGKDTPIPEGSRNATLTRLAGSLRRSAFSEAGILGALLEENAARCDPPLGEEEVRGIARSVGRYKPGTAEPARDAPRMWTPEGEGAESQGENGAVEGESHVWMRLPETTYGDVFNAELLIIKHGHVLKYCKEWYCWYIWKDTHWQKDRENEVYDYARRVLREVGHFAVESDDDKLLKHIIKSRSNFCLRNMLEQAGTMAEVRTVPEDFDRWPWYLNCKNGTVDLKTGTVLAHDPDHLITKLVTTAYNPEATCPRWEKFLGQIMNTPQACEDADTSALIQEESHESHLKAEALTAFLRRSIGYTLAGTTQEKIMLVLWGAGNNGKSTFVETISDLLGPGYVMRTPANMLLAKQDGAIPNDIAQLKGMRMAYSAEPPDGKRLDGPLIKDLTGGDTISARFMRGEFFTFRPECTLWMSTNHKPPTRDTGNALWNRIKLVPFTVEIPEEQQDKDLRKHLLRESEGILAWAIKGCMEWQESGMAEPEEVKMATREYRSDNDSIGAFIDDVCLTGPNYHAAAALLYEEYKKWCDRTGEFCQTQNRFGAALTEKGFDRQKSSRKVYLGIGVQESDKSSTDDPF